MVTDDEEKLVDLKFEHGFIAKNGGWMPLAWGIARFLGTSALIVLSVIAGASANKKRESAVEFTLAAFFVSSVSLDDLHAIVLFG